MRSIALLALSSAVLMLSGCATQKELMVTNASRADGIVNLSYESNEFQRVSYDAQKAQDLAAQKCKVWGYNGAEALGSEENICLSRRGFGNCGSRRVTVAYQCTGAPNGQ
jgi:hypothetical protein